MIKAFSAWLALSPASQAIQQHLWIVPTVQSLHILAIAILLFAAASGGWSVARGGSAQAMPWIATGYRWTWWALAVLLASGAVLVVGEPERSLLNTFFRIKMLLVVLAASATAILQSHLSRADRQTGFTDRALAAGSILLWATIILCGRLIAYFGTPPA